MRCAGQGRPGVEGVLPERTVREELEAAAETGSFVTTCLVRAGALLARNAHIRPERFVTPA